MKIKLITALNNRHKCNYDKCSKNTIYITETGKIKEGTTCVVITIPLGNSRKYSGKSYYCRDCIDKIYGDMKKILNPQLWAFI